MSFVYILIVYNLLHHVQAVLPGSYPDINSCNAAKVQTHVTFGNWVSCEPLAVKPSAMKGHYHKVPVKPHHRPHHK